MKTELKIFTCTMPALYFDSITFWWKISALYSSSFLSFRVEEEAKYHKIVTFTSIKVKICELLTKQLMWQNIQPQSCETSVLQTVRWKHSRHLMWLSLAWILLHMLILLTLFSLLLSFVVDCVSLLWEICSSPQRTSVDLPSIKGLLYVNIWLPFIVCVFQTPRCVSLHYCLGFR